jgi:hypothetical protein
MFEKWLENTQILDESGYYDKVDGEFIKLSKYNAPRKNMKSRWSTKYKKSIDCNNPKGFSQKQFCKRKRRGGKYKS